jgi:hypothetical protein
VLVFLDDGDLSEQLMLVPSRLEEVFVKLVEAQPAEDAVLALRAFDGDRDTRELRTSVRSGLVRLNRRVNAGADRSLVDSRERTPATRGCLLWPASARAATDRQVARLADEPAGARARTAGERWKTALHAVLAELGEGGQPRF